MRIGMRLLLGYFLLVAVAAWFVLAIFVKEVKPGVRRATEGTLIDTATLLAELARPDLLSGDPTHGQLAQAFNQMVVTTQKAIGEMDSERRLLEGVLQGMDDGVLAVDSDGGVLVFIIFVFVRTGTATGIKCIPIKVSPISIPALALTSSTITGCSNPAYAAVPNDPPAFN